MNHLPPPRPPLQIQFMGQAMSVNRPSGYVDPSKAAVAAQAATHALTAFQQVRGGRGGELWGREVGPRQQRTP